MRPRSATTIITNWALKPSVSSAPPGEGLPQQPLPSGESHEAGSNPVAHQRSMS